MNQPPSSAADVESPRAALLILTVLLSTLLVGCDARWRTMCAIERAQSIGATETVSANSDEAALDKTLSDFAARYHFIEKEDELSGKSKGYHRFFVSRKGYHPIELEACFRDGKLHVEITVFQTGGGFKSPVYCLRRDALLKELKKVFGDRLKILDRAS